MANKNNKVVFKKLNADDPVFQSGFTLSPISIKQRYIHQREQKEGSKNEFLCGFKSNQPRHSRIQQLIKVLTQKGWRLKKDYD